ncbi:MAG: hypothetical protein H0U70_04125 [Tatlockia sp.]|nr:hypothetical protein [Tatlockia sp.]
MPNKSAGAVSAHIAFAFSAAGIYGVPFAVSLPVAIPVVIGAAAGGTVGLIGYGIYGLFSGSTEKTQPRQRHAEPEHNNCIIC